MTLSTTVVGVPTVSATDDEGEKAVEAPDKRPATLRVTVELKIP